MKDNKNKIMAVFVLIINTMWTILLTMPEAPNMFWTGRVVSVVALTVMVAIQLFLMF